MKKSGGGKQEKLFHEVIFQIGNKDDMNAKNEDGLLSLIHICLATTIQ